MSLLALAILVTACGPFSDERCLELLTDGLPPSATTWITAAGYRQDESRASMYVGPGQFRVAEGSHSAACISPGNDETWRLLVWFDDAAASPFDTYCKDLLDNPDVDCSPRPGQPFGEKTFRFDGRGLTTVTVTIHQP